MRSLLFTCIVALAAAPTTAAAQTVTCADGTTSEAGRGACSHHGGVEKTRAPRTAPKREAPATRADRDTTTRKADTSPDRSESTRKADTSRDSSRKSQSPVVQCEDGTLSIATGRGACSHHGGVKQSQARTQTRDTRAPRRDTRHDTRQDKPWWGDDGVRENEPMARCLDGTISYSRHHRGTCSNHGGVRDWLDD